MNILSMDTATDLLSLELVTSASRIFIVRDFGLKHSEKLLDSIRALLSEGEVSPAEIDLFACTAGPGSFTGLRIAMATVKGLAAGVGKPFVVVPTLDYLAYGLEYFPGLVVPVIDAKKGRIYCAFFEAGKKISRDLDITADELIGVLKGREQVLFTGPFAEKIVSDCRDALRCTASVLNNRGNPGALSALAEAEFTAHGGAPSDLSPLYIRKSEAEILADDRS